MTKLWYKATHQKDAYTSSWSAKEIVKIYLWKIVWLLFYRITPKHFFNRWRLFLLKMFGAQISGCPFVYSSSKIFAPWNLEIKHKACLGPRSEVYNLGPVIIHEMVTISQDCYICNGTHDLSKSSLPLMMGVIEIKSCVFIGAKALILPGLTIGEYAVIGAGSVVTKNVEPWVVVGGNPAKFIKQRVIKE